MKRVYEIIGCIDRALGESVEADFNDFFAQGDVLNALQEAVRDAKALAEDCTAALSIHEAVSLVNNLNAVCKHFLLMKVPELALEAFVVEYRLPERVDLDSTESDALFATLKETLVDLFTVAWNAKQQEPFIDAALPARLGFTPAAMTLKSHLYTLKAEILMRRDEPDTALFCLLEAYSSLADSVSQGDMILDDMRLKLLRDIRRCLDAKGDRRLARWIQRKMDIIKARNGIDAAPNESLPPVRESWPCAAFAMQDAQAAYEHLSDYKVVKHYGKGEFVGSEGYRHLGRCPKCGGFLLVQRSELHGDVDDYYADFFSVNGPADADAINDKFDGESIEEKFPMKYLIETNGRIAWYDLHLRQKAGE